MCLNMQFSFVSFHDEVSKTVFKSYLIDFFFDLRFDYVCKDGATIIAILTLLPIFNVIARPVIVAC